MEVEIFQNNRVGVDLYSLTINQTCIVHHVMQYSTSWYSCHIFWYCTSSIILNDIFNSLFPVFCTAWKEGSEFLYSWTSWNKELDISKPFYNKVILLVPALYDWDGHFQGRKVLFLMLITYRFHCTHVHKFPWGKNLDNRILQGGERKFSNVHKHGTCILKDIV